MLFSQTQLKVGHEKVVVRTRALSARVVLWLLVAAALFPFPPGTRTKPVMTVDKVLTVKIKILHNRIL